MPLHAPFPRASSAFVGRRDELARVEELFADEVLFLVYGIAGIGKTEFVYKVFGEAQKLARLRAATPLLIQARAGQRTDHLLSILRFRLTEKRGRRGGCDTAPSYDEDLVEVTRLLEARPFLVFIDDLHFLEGETAAMLSHLARHVSRSRIFAASRTELLFAVDAPTPVFVRLQSLDASSTHELVAALSRRMDVAVPDGEQLFERSGGSPYLVRRELARLRYLPADLEERHDWTLSQLTHEARQALLLGRALRGRLSLEELERQGFAKQVVWELARHFLIDIDRGAITVHELTWEALRPLLSDADVNQARRDGAELLLRRFLESPAGQAADCIEALQLWIRGGDHERAFAALRSSYSAIAAAGLDHLLLDVLATLRQGPPERRIAADLLAVRIHLRRSQMVEAQRLLDELALEPAAARSSRFLRLSGEVSQRLGKLPEARQRFALAEMAAETARERFSTRLQLANVASFSGDGPAARAVLELARAEMPAAKSVETARWAWSLALSFLVEDRLQEAIDAVVLTSAQLGSDASVDTDARVLLGMHELVARIETDDLVAARAVGDRVLHSAAAAGALREQIVAVYRGALLFAEGELVTARGVLDEALARLERQQDFVPAALAGYYLARTLIGLGQVGSARTVAARLSRLVRSAGLQSLMATATLLEAQALLAAAEPAAARALAAPLAAAASSVPRARAEAQQLVARACALHGDGAGASAAMASARAAAQAAPAGAWQRLELVGAELVAWYGLAGDGVDAVAVAEPIVDYFAACGRRYDEARAATVLAAALLQRNGGGDLARADQLVGRIHELAAAHAYGLIHLRAALCDAAIQRRRGQERRTKALLEDAADDPIAAEPSFEARLVRLAAGRADADPMPAFAVVLRRLGLGETERVEVIGRAGSRSVDEAERQHICSTHELIVDVDLGSLARGGGGATISGRPLMAALMVALIKAGDEGLGAERLFYDVWGGRRYDPLRHRNTIYVGITRLRQALRSLVPGRDIVETCADGWRLARGVDVCAIRAEKVK